MKRIYINTVKSSYFLCQFSIFKLPWKGP